MITLLTSTGLLFYGMFRTNSYCCFAYVNCESTERKKGRTPPLMFSPNIPANTNV